jgi:hypothetical protein
MTASSAAPTEDPAAVQPVRFSHVTQDEPVEYQAPAVPDRRNPPPAMQPLFAAPAGLESSSDTELAEPVPPARRPVRRYNGDRNGRRRNG